MKLKNKLIIIFILFAFFVIFNNSDCFAAQYLSIDNTLYNLADYDNLLTSSENVAVIYRSQNDSIYLVTTRSAPSSSSYRNWPTVNGLPGTSIWLLSKLHRYLYNFSSDSWVLVGSSNENMCFTNYKDILFSTVDIYYTANSSHTSQVIYSAYSSLYTVPETTKHDLFQLNLTDNNFNNALHTFTLNADEYFVNYSELTDLIENNNKYCIYVTDYTRLLTFSDNSFNATLEGGSYLLSGYIDFLVSDNAYFYFSPHYNRIKVCSGDYRGQDMSTYTKRYFFNLVYSDDSDDTYFTILDDNGLLWSLSDYVNDGINSSSDYLTDIQNSYFIGSNQTIYYANEDSNYILDSLSDSIYYGKDRGADERIYNFGFSGGNKKEFYLNEATFDDNVATQNEIITEKSPVVSSEETFEPVIIHDESSGNSSVIPQDSTTYTYPANTVTDETTPEEDATHRQNERTSYTSTDSNDDTSNWSLWDFIKGIFGKIGNLISSIGNLVTDLISGLVNLFIPTAQQWDSLKNDYSVLGDTIQSHLPFVSFIRSTFEEAQNTVISPFDFLNITMPSFLFFGGNTEQTNYVNVRDAYEPYRIQIRSWLVLIVYGVAFVYIVKHVSDYGATQYANSGLEALQSGNRLGRGKGD